MAVLITGGLGVIGRRLTQHLRERGYDVKVTDIAIRKEQDYRRADVTRYEELSEVFQLGRSNMSSTSPAKLVARRVRVSTALCRHQRVGHAEPDPAVR